MSVSKTLLLAHVGSDRTSFDSQGLQVKLSVLLCYPYLNRLMKCCLDIVTTTAAGQQSGLLRYFKLIKRDPFRVILVNKVEQV